MYFYWRGICMCGAFIFMMAVQITVCSKYHVQLHDINYMLTECEVDHDPRILDQPWAKCLIRLNTLRCVKGLKIFNHTVPPYILHDFFSVLYAMLFVSQSTS